MNRNRLVIVLAAVVGIAVGSTGTLAAQRLLGNRPAVGLLTNSSSPSAGAAPSPTAPAPSSSASASPAASRTPSPSNLVRPGASDDPAHKQVVMFGGAVDMGGLQPTNDTWTWDGAKWTQQHPAHSPSARYGAAMAYDADHGVVVLFGGSGSRGTLTDTWTWDGADWHQLNPTTSPPAMDDPAMAAFPPKHELVMYFFSESWPGAPANDTWTWNGSNWSDAGSATAARDLTGSPSRIAYLQTTKTIYRVGHDATLAYNGSTWTQVGSGPTTVDFTLAPDQSSGTMVGVSAGEGPFKWNGAGWNGWAGATPTYRLGTASVWDSTRNVVMLFAGNIAGLDTWTYTGNGGWIPPRTVASNGVG